jgi:hypothetical protein
MKLIKSLVPLCAMLLPCALSAGSFEGTLTMTMSSSKSKDGPQTINYSIKEGYMRMDMQHEGAPVGAFITDFKNRQIIILMPQQQMYLVKALPDPSTYKKPEAAGKASSSSDNSSDTKFTDTGIRESILGYSCEKYAVTNSKGVAYIWATDELGFFGGLTMGGAPGRHSQAPQEWESIIKGSGFFPLRVVGTEKGKPDFRLEVTSIDKRSLPTSLFMPPDGWRKFDLGSMFGGALQGAFGGHPSDGNN